VKVLSKRTILPKIVRREEDCVNKLKDINGIAKLVDSYDDDEKFYLVFEFIAGDNLLNHLLKRRSPFPEAIAKKIFAQLCATVQQVHEKGVIHHGIF
jgi:serine/threonine protein kinase